MAIIRNITIPPANVPLDDLGITIHIGEDYDLGLRPIENVYNSDDLMDAITTSKLIYLDAQGNPLSLQESLDAQSGINSITPAFILQDNGSNVSGTPHSKLNFGDNLNVTNQGSGAATVDALQTIILQDDGSGVTETPHTTLNFGTNLSVTNDGSGVATIDASGGGTIADLPAIQIRRTTAYNNVPLTWMDLTFDATDLENNNSVIEHNDTNTDDIDIKEDGLYWLYYNVGVDDEVKCRIRVDDTTVVPGSEKQVGDPNDVNDIIGGDSVGVIYSLSSGQKITLQISASTTSENIQAEATFIIIKLQGIKGDKGDPGSGSSIEVQENDSTVNSTTDTLNFEGDGVSVADEGNGKVTATISGGVFGQNYAYSNVEGTSSTTSTTYQLKATLTTASIPSGTYRMSCHIETHNTSTSGRTGVMCNLNDTITMCESSNEAEDSHDWVPFVCFDHMSLSGINTVKLYYNCANSIGTSSVRRARIEFWRVA